MVCKKKGSNFGFFGENDTLVTCAVRLVVDSDEE